MRSKLLTGALLGAVAGAVLLGGGPASASMYYPWGGQFPWDRPGTVNPDIITGALLATSTHWAGIGDYGFYRPTFGGNCRGGKCRAWDRW